MDRHNPNEVLLDYLYGELGPAEKAEVERLLETDAEWRKTLESLRRTHGLLDALPEEVPSQGLRERILHRVEAESRSARTSPLRDLLGNFLNTILPIVASVVVAGVVLGLTLVGAPQPGTAALLSIAVVAALSGSFYHLLFQAVIQPETRYVRLPARRSPAGFIHVELKRCAVFAFLAFALFIVAALVIPNPASFETRSLYRGISRAIPEWTAYLLPALYAAIGCFSAGRFLGRKVRGNREAQGILMGILAGILIVLDLLASYFSLQGTLSHLLFWSLTAFTAAILFSWMGARWAGVRNE